MKKPGIPPVPQPGEKRDGFDRAIKETLEILIGARGGRIKALPADADLAAIVAKINEILGVVQ